MTERFFAPCPRGLEAALAAELTRIGATDVAVADGGVGFAGGLDLACRANLESRIASRVLWRVGGGPYRDEHALYDAGQGRRLEGAVRADAHAARRRRGHALAAAEPRVRDAARQGRRLRPAARRHGRAAVDRQARSPTSASHVYLTDRDATVYLDTSGEPLFKRGYRRDTDEAPLRENLAAGLLALTGWTPDVPFLDPMCGSGTIAVEAALIAADRAPGLARTFGFQKLAWFDGPAWQRMKQTARDRIRAAPAVPALFASDLAPGAVAKAQSNLRAAQVDAFVARRDGRLPRACRRRRRAACCSPIRPTACGSTTRRSSRAFYPLAGRRAEAALRGLDRVLLHRRPAAAEAHPPQGHAQDAALQRRARVPAVRVPDRRRPACARGLKRSRVIESPLHPPSRSTRHAHASVPALRVGPHAVHPRARRRRSRTCRRSSRKAAGSGGTSRPTTCANARGWTKAACRRRRTSTRRIRFPPTTPSASSPQGALASGRPFGEHRPRRRLRRPPPGGARLGAALRRASPPTTPSASSPRGGARLGAALRRASVPPEGALASGRPFGEHRLTPARRAPPSRRAVRFVQARPRRIPTPSVPRRSRAGTTRPRRAPSACPSPVRSP